MVEAFIIVVAEGVPCLFLQVGHSAAECQQRCADAMRLGGGMSGPNNGLLVADSGRNGRLECFIVGVSVLGEKVQVR